MDLTKLPKESCSVVVFEHPKGIISGCAKCLTVLRQGTWGVGLILSEGKPEEARYIVCVNPRLRCCGEEKKMTLEAFATEAEAEELQKQVIDQLNRDGTTANLVLAGFAFVTHDAPSNLQ